LRHAFRFDEAAGQSCREQTNFGTMTQDLTGLAKWLREHRVTHVGMESTGPYWKPIWNIPESRGRIPLGDPGGRLELVLAKTRHVKAIPGHQTDGKDGRRIAELLQHNLLPRSSVRPRAIRRRGN
jgi:hypothetical protein